MPLATNAGAIWLSAASWWISRTEGGCGNAASGRRGFAAAEAYCASLVIHGLRGWRLPTNPEIGTIVLRPLGLGGRPDACVPSLDQAAFSFPDPAGLLWFWTSNAQPPQPLRFLREFIDGRSPRAFEDDAEVWVRCVHDPLF